MRLVPLIDIARDCLERGERASLYVRWGSHDLVLRPKPGQALDLPRDAVPYMVHTEGNEPAWYVNPARLYDLPLRHARTLWDDAAAPVDRETWQLRDSLRRALLEPHLFNGAAYAVPSWLSESRARDTERKLCAWPGIDEPHVDPSYGPWCADYGAKRHDPNDPAWQVLLAQVGMRIDERGRYQITPPPAPENDNGTRSTAAKEAAE